MFRDKRVELWINAEICVLNEDESVFDVPIEEATAPANTVIDDDEGIRWGRDSSWESFDEETANRVSYELIEAEPHIRQILADVSVLGLMNVTGALEKKGDRVGISLGSMRVDLEGGRVLNFTFSLDLYWAD